MKAGRMRHSIIVKDFINTPNEDGTPNETWTEVFRVKGNIVWLRGKSYFENYEFLYEVKGRVYTRYRTDFENRYRIEIDGVDYDIENVVPADNKNKELEIVFKAVEQ